MKPFFSIVIPYHNSQETIVSLLTSIRDSKGAPELEVIVVDDGSSVSFEENSFKRGRLAKLNVRIIRLEKNRGPAVARNRGAAVAKGTYLLFLDSDVQLLPDALANLSAIYRDDPDITAVTGVWMKHQKSKKFFPNFKALRDWSYWINERDKSGYYYLFSTRIASIKREVFVRLKGFDETYSAPLVEDIEFTYRIARRYAIIFAPNVRVRHEFEDFWPIAKKYFWRSYYWTKLYRSRKKFDPVATTLQEAITAMSGVGLAGLVPVPAVLFLVGSIPDVIGQSAIVLTFLILCIHLFLTRRFLVFAMQEKGFGFAVQSFFMGIILYCFIGAGALWGRVR